MRWLSWLSWFWFASSEGRVRLSVYGALIVSAAKGLSYILSHATQLIISPLAKSLARPGVVASGATATARDAMPRGGRGDKRALACGTTDEAVSRGRKPDGRARVSCAES